MAHASQRTRPTFTLALVGPVLAVDLPVAAQAEVNALPAVALELVLGADGTVLLVAAVVTLGVAVAPPGLRDAVHLAGGAGELLRGAGGRLCRRAETGSGSEGGGVNEAVREEGGGACVSPPQDSSFCSSTRWTGHEQRVVPSPFTMQMWEQPPLSHVHGCLPAGTERTGETETAQVYGPHRPSGAGL